MSETILKIFNHTWKSLNNIYYSRTVSSLEEAMIFNEILPALFLYNCNFLARRPEHHQRNLKVFLSFHPDKQVVHAPWT